MNRAFSRISLALAAAAGLMAAALSPASADGDPYYSNGINPTGVRTPVPAPIPYPVEEAEWYFRGDFAAGFGASPSVNVLGTNLLESFLSTEGEYSQAFEPSFMGTIGVGYVWGPHIRTDFTVDLHSIMHAENTVNLAYVDGGGAQLASAEDKVKLMSTILMLNAYYDFRTGTPWTPYLGGGLGFAVNQITRNFTLNDTGSLAIGTPVAFQEGKRSTDIQFAAAAMAGVTYDVSSFWAIDVNYRFMHMGGAQVSFNEPGLFNSTTEIGSLNEHQIRAGVRFYVN